MALDCPWVLFPDHNVCIMSLRNEKSLTPNLLHLNLSFTKPLPLGLFAHLSQKKDKEQKESYSQLLNHMCQTLVNAPRPTKETIRLAELLGTYPPMWYTPCWKSQANTWPRLT